MSVIASPTKAISGTMVHFPRQVFQLIVNYVLANVAVDMGRPKYSTSRDQGQG